MDTSSIRILETISSNLGRPMSISQLTGRIKDSYGKAYYANTYQKLKVLEKEGIVVLDQIGKSSNIKLCFQNYLLTFILAEMEIEKTKEFLTRKSDLMMLLSEMEEKLSNRCPLKSSLAADPDRNLKLNRLETLFLLSQTPNHYQETLTLSREVQRLQSKHNLKIDSLILDNAEFQILSTAEEINPVREILANRIILFGAEAFWRLVKGIEEKMGIRILHEKTRPSNISEADLAYNLGRFGYREFCRSSNVGKKICIEYIATALLLQDDIRLRDAAPVILAKNTFSLNMLAFLSRKYGTADVLIGILRALQELKPAEEIKQTIDLLSVFNTIETPTDRQRIESKLRLYNAL